MTIGVDMSELKKVPDFKNEQEEREFWETHDSSEYLDLSKAERVAFPNLRAKKTKLKKGKIDD